MCRWVGVVGSDGDLELAEHPVGLFFALAQDAQCPDPLAVEAEALGKRGRHKEGQTGRYKFGNDGAVFCDAVAEALIGHVQKGNQAPGLDRSDHLVPLSSGDVVAGRVMTAGVQDHDRARGRRVQCVEHALKVHPPGGGIVVGVGLDREAGVVEQRTVVFPTRVADQHLGRRGQPLEEIGTDLQATGAADGLNGGDSARLHRLAARSEDQCFDRCVIGGDAVDRQVAARGRFFRHALFSRLHALQQRQLAVVVVIDPHAQIDLVRVGIGCKLLVEPQDRIAWGHFDGVEQRHGVPSNEKSVSRLQTGLLRWAGPPQWAGLSWHAGRGSRILFGCPNFNGPG